MIRKVVLILLLVFISMDASFAQCAMCRSTLENNVSNGDPGIASGINTGILYLLVMPYLAVVVLAYLWFKSSRDAKKKLSDGVS
jgi:hypothetical protein